MKVLFLLGLVLAGAQGARAEAGRPIFECRSPSASLRFEARLYHFGYLPVRGISATLHGVEAALSGPAEHDFFTSRFLSRGLIFEVNSTGDFTDLPKFSLRVKLFGGGSEERESGACELVSE